MYHVNVGCACVFSCVVHGEVDVAARGTHVLNGDSWSHIPYKPSQVITVYMILLHLTLPLRIDCFPTTLGSVSLVM